MLPKSNTTPYKWGIHQSFISLFVDLAEVDPIGRVGQVWGVYGHKRTHELARVHWAKEVALHVFAKLLFACLGEWNRLGAVQVVAPGGRFGRRRVEGSGGHGQRGEISGEPFTLAWKYIAEFANPNTRTRGTESQIQNQPEMDSDEIIASRRSQVITPNEHCERDCGYGRVGG